MGLSLACLEAEGSSSICFRNDSSSPRLLKSVALTGGKFDESCSYTEEEERDASRTSEVLNPWFSVSTDYNDEWHADSLQALDRDQRSVRLPSSLMRDGSSERPYATSRKRMYAWPSTSNCGEAMGEDASSLHLPFGRRRGPDLDDTVGARQVSGPNQAFPDRRCLGNLPCRIPTVPIPMDRVTPFHRLPTMLQHTQLFQTAPWIEPVVAPKMPHYDETDPRLLTLKDEAHRLVSGLHNVESAAHDHWWDLICLPQEQTHLHPAAFASADRKQWDEAFSPDHSPGLDMPILDVSPGQGAVLAPGRCFTTPAERTEKRGLGQVAHTQGLGCSAHLPNLPLSAMGRVAEVGLEPEEPEPFSLAALQRDLVLRSL
ncbi:BQ2448_190 [Microbotryum intermedium]|uniref:BQ2448_190 protein n=1 Tax=Microbotryum intermedium TaxID=269621 RepID=A0A238F5R0_9BASI|nr:BQ2448_190 [Microbotryum intermedium]